MRKGIVIGGFVLLALAGAILFSRSVLAGKAYQEEVVAGHAVEEISVDVQDWSVKFSYSENADIRVIISGSSSEKAEKPVKVQLQEQRLEITQVKEIRDFISNFSLGKEKEVVIMLPRESDYIIKVDSTSGDIYLNEISAMDIGIETNSGEVIAGNLTEEGKLDISTKSGDVNVKFAKQPEFIYIDAETKKQELVCSLNLITEEVQTTKIFRGGDKKSGNRLTIASESGYIYIK